MTENALFISTALFESKTPGPNFINPKCFGEDFARWLQLKLREIGIHAEELSQEDWGWCFKIRRENGIFLVALGIMDEFIGRSPAVWRVATVYDKSMNGITAFFSSIPAQTLESLHQQICKIIGAEQNMAIIDEP